jgi:predicted RNase H-like nuclease
MGSAKDVERVRKALRAKLGSGADVVVAEAELRLLLDEVGRLMQSNDRLRRQNRRVRLKLQGAGIGDDEADTQGVEDPIDEV